MRYFLLVFAVLLSGCASQMIGVDRQTGERITIHFADHLAYVELKTTLPDGETFTGKLIESDGATINDDGRIVMVSGNSFKSVMLGDKTRTMRCEVCGGMSGGVGSCTTSDGRVFDVTW